MKPVQLYLIAIDWLKDHQKNINYRGVEKLIKDDIKIRDKVRKIITPLEEHIRARYCADKNDPEFNIVNSAKFKNLYKKHKLNDIISTYTRNPDKQYFRKIQYIRNNVNHLSYPLLFQDFDEILQGLDQIKKLEFVDNNKIIKLIQKIKKIQAKWL